MLQSRLRYVRPHCWPSRPLDIMIPSKGRSARAAVYRAILVHATHVRSTTLFIRGRSHVVNTSPPGGVSNPDLATVDLPRTFHRRMAAIIDAVQAGIWEAG